MGYALRGFAVRGFTVVLLDFEVVRGFVVFW